MTRNSRNQKSKKDGGSYLTETNEKDTYCHQRSEMTKTCGKCGRKTKGDRKEKMRGTCLEFKLPYADLVDKDKIKEKSRNHKTTDKETMMRRMES